MAANEPSSRSPILARRQLQTGIDHRHRERISQQALFDLDQINGDFAATDVVIVIGANDVCNPAATKDPKSPIAGMPVLNVWEARTVFVIKRSLASGYAGIKNPLFDRENTLMCFADAKAYLEALITELKAR